MRKFSALLNLLLFTASLFLLSSCQKDPAADPAGTNCQLVKTYYFNLGGDIADSLEYSYTGDKLTRAFTPAGYFTLEYTNEKVTRINYYDQGASSSEEYFIAAYNTDGTIASIKKYYISGASPIQYSQYDFSYSTGKLIKFDFKDLDYNTNQLELYESTTYTYVGNNITRASLTDHDIPGEIETYDYSYDSNENYFAKNDALLTEVLFFNDPGGESLPLILSDNNVTKAYDGYDESMITYKLDDKKNLYEFYIEGGTESRYLYSCK